MKKEFLTKDVFGRQINSSILTGEPKNEKELRIKYENESGRYWGDHWHYRNWLEQNILKKEN
jgi:TfoX/Sxy family transcriptional regulator of competence genes